MTDQNKRISWTCPECGVVDGCVHLPATRIDRNEDMLARLHGRREREKDLYNRLRDGDR